MPGNSYTTSFATGVDLVSVYGSSVHAVYLIDPQFIHSLLDSRGRESRRNGGWT